MLQARLDRINVPAGDDDGDPLVLNGCRCLDGGLSYFLLQKF
jgi:hypothetical protein